MHHKSYVQYCVVNLLIFPKNLLAVKIDVLSYYLSYHSIIATAGNSIVMSGARFIQIQTTETSVLSRLVNQVLFLRAMTLKDELSKGYYVVKKATATFESCDALPLKDIHSLYKHWTTFSIEIIIWSENSLFHLIVTLTFIFLYCSISYLFSDLCLDLWFLGISDLFFLWTYECFHFNCLQDFVKLGANFFSPILSEEV